MVHDALATVIAVQWFGSSAVEITYKTADGKVSQEILYRDAEPRLEIVAAGRPWSFDGDGSMFRLMVSEAHRIRLAYLFDPVMAVHTSLRPTAPPDHCSGRTPARPASPCAICWPTNQAPARRSGRTAHQGADGTGRRIALPYRLSPHPSMEYLNLPRCGKPRQAQKPEASR